MTRNKPFEDTPEAQEYLDSLQNGKRDLHPDASSLESTVLESLRELNDRLKKGGATQGNLDRQISTLQKHRMQVTEEIVMMSGEATAYAKLLVAAEGARKKPQLSKNAPEVESADTEKNATVEPQQGENIIKPPFPRPHPGP